MDKTFKLRAYNPDANKEEAPGKPAKEQIESSALEKKTAQLEEEQKKSLELLKTIIRLREDLKQEQERSAGLEAKLHKLDAVEENQLVRKNAELEEVRNKLAEYLKLNEHLKKSIEQEQAAAAEMAKKAEALEAGVGQSTAVAEQELAVRSGQLEAEKQRSIELRAMIEQLRDSLRQEQAKAASAAEKAKGLEDRVKELSETLGKIAGIAATGKPDSGA
ncbi:MAG: hypothetical protein KJ795_06660 [Gammaproteobacteria bacterium]|nr:hypothetical protein [Gammaproteobacteria bacterium]MBU1777052.1 hypothetical protein [Gammaproteobacteria bacterium]MBU1969663.1 hypothetical protein [Gammaproteobacteria bacterium]